ncbi:DUF6520 family protein [Leeuwenhoekiella marinoflava]|uniref:DUF6520 family protein n=1 Tax=Leeuwenhoekiella marinoflava TaxID=988 RepID=UPI0030025FA6
MRNLKKQMLVPVAAIGLALGGAFMTSAAKVDAAANAQVPGYYYDNVQLECRDAGVECSTVDTGIPCTDGTRNLFELEGTMCETPLYQIPQ